MQATEIKTLKELKKICCDFVKDFKIPQLVLLEGPLAIGKSQMVRYMAEALGCPKEEICSPTFSLINVYKKSNKESIYHVDFFRLENEMELETTAFWDIFYSPTIVFIEWPQLVKKNLPPLWNKFYIEISFAKNKNSRVIQWTQDKKSGAA